MDHENWIGKKIDEYSITDLLGEGYYGITFLAKDKLNKNVAIKILKEPKLGWDDEAKKAAKLLDVEEIASVNTTGTCTIEIDGSQRVCKYIISEYIDGVSLDKFLRDPTHITTTFIIQFAIAICDAIQGMQHYKLEHNDLHANNILLENPKPWSSNTNYKVKIVDFGQLSYPKTTQHSDMEQLADHLQRCWNSNYEIPNAKKIQDKKFQEKLHTLIIMLKDPDPDRRLTDPREVKEYFKNKLIKPEEKEQTELSHPFDFSNVEQIPENSNLLQKLYVDTVPWLKEIECDNTIIISGPRGSGKSMILKNMRLLTKLKSSMSEISMDELPYIGFYIHCPTLLSSAFWGVNVIYDNVTCDKFIHYFNLLLTSEILTSLITLEEIKKISIEDFAKNNLFSFLDKTLLSNRSYSLSNNDKMTHYKSLIENEISICINQIKQNKPLTKETSVDFLKNIFNVLDQISGFFVNKKIYILLDDYSLSSVNKPIQKSLNRIIGFRNSKFYFKITTEKFGFVFSDQNGKLLEQDREYSYIDLGRSYIASRNDVLKKEFIRTIFNKRLSNCPKMSATIDDMFESKSTKKISEMLCNFTTRKVDATFDYAGFDMIYKLCIGDVGTLLQLCKKIYDHQRTINGNVDKIPSNIQDHIIRRVSRERFESIKAIKTYGRDIHKFVEKFGSISQHHLLRTKNPSAPDEIIRIELTNYDPSVKSDLYMQLIMNNVFIDAGNTYPRITGGIHSVPTLLLRPIYTPALQISYNNRNALRFDWRHFSKLLKNPEGMSRGVHIRDDQSNLIDTTLKDSGNTEIFCDVDD